MNMNQALELFTRTGALHQGHFELRSGLHSDQYFQCALVLQYPHIVEQLCRAQVERARSAWSGRAIDGVISPALGGIPVGHEIARILDTKAIFAEKAENKLVLRRGFRIEPGQQYVIAEDVITRGGRVQELIDIVTRRGGEVAAILIVVDRSGGAVSFSYPVISLIEMTPTVWSPDECPLCRQGLPIDHPGS